MAILKSYYRYPIKCSETVTVVFLILILFLCHSAGMHKVNYVEVPFFNHSSTIFSLHTRAAT